MTGVSRACAKIGSELMASFIEVTHVAHGTDGLVLVQLGLPGLALTCLACLAAAWTGTESCCKTVRPRILRLDI